MKVDNPNAFRFLLQDEIYLLNEDKIAPAVKAAEQPTEPILQTPEQPVAQPAPIAAAETVASLPVSPAIAAPATPVVKTPGAGFNYLGNNNKNFVILVNYAGDEHMPAAHLTAMENILKRKEYALSDVAIFNINKYAPVTMAKLAETFQPVKLLIMGTDALPQGIGNLPLNKPVQGKKTNVLYSFSFDEMMSSNDNKKAFWDQMKTL